MHAGRSLVVCCGGKFAMKQITGFAMVLLTCFPVVAATPAARIDHIMLGIDDLDRGVELFEQKTGVRPVYGGKHPGGTHNALVSLGDGTYLEIIAVQRDVKPPDEYAGLKQLHTLTPIGWAVSSTDSAQLRSRLSSAGLDVTDPSPGSRTTPAGATLSWQTFGLKDNFDEAPFFIVWSPQTLHPSTTSPKGCTLQRWRIAGAHQKALAQLRDALDLRVDVAEASATSLQLSLHCPKGSVEFHQ
jgi:catechol 2,3-dioxygenase-like lactoylglutathione lyase family enzyme